MWRKPYKKFLNMRYGNEVGNGYIKAKPTILAGFMVIRLGLEPRTPSLKGMCSTC